MHPRPCGRRMTPQRAEFRRLAQSAEIGTVTRGQLAVLAQNLTCTGILNATESHLLVTLINTAPAEAFDKSGRPIIFKSNRQLAFEIGRSAGRVSRMLASLFDAGLVTMQDSGNYKRYPVRNGDGAIVDGCGIDMRILIARYRELDQLVRQARAEKSAASAALRRYRGALRIARYAFATVTSLSDRALARIHGRMERGRCSCWRCGQSAERPATPRNGSFGVVRRASDAASASGRDDAGNRKFDMHGCRKRHTQTEYKPPSI